MNLYLARGNESLQQSLCLLQTENAELRKANKTQMRALLKYGKGGRARRRSCRVSRVRMRHSHRRAAYRRKQLRTQVRAGKT
jgi:hypothetical protein